MAQTMRISSGRGGRGFGNPAAANGFLPAGAADFFRRRLTEAVGLVLFAVAAWLAVAILSYTPGDPSLNSAGNGEIGNFLGSGGAMAADLALQTFGLASLVPVVVLIAWGWRKVTKRGVSAWGLKLAFLLAAMFLLAAGLNILSTPENWPLMTRLGGVAGGLSAGPISFVVRVFGISPEITAAAAAVSWMVVEWIFRAKPSVLGIISGAGAGLVAITPASGYVDPFGALVIGLLAGVVCYWGAVVLKPKLGYDDTLDVFGVHGLGGITGAVLTGVFAVEAIGGTPGLLEGNAGQVITQIEGILATIVYCAIATFVILKVVGAVMGLRVDEETEIGGLDYNLHGETVQ